MKKLLALFALLALACLSVAAVSAPASPAVLSQATKNGVTTIVTTGRIQADAALNADGSATFTIFPSVLLLDNAGQPIAPAQLDTAAGFAVNLPADLVAKIMVEVKAAYDTKQAAAFEKPASL
jgi:hypothetical protein